MAGTLFDSLQKKLSEPAAPAPVGQQSTIANVLKAKSGKASSGGGPAASSVAQDAALVQGQNALAQQQQQGAIAGMGMQQAADAQAQATQQAQTDMASQRQSALADLTSKQQATSESILGQEQMAMSGLDANQSLKTRQLNHAADQQLRELASEKGLTIDNIFREFDRSNKELAFRKDAAAIEQAGFLLAIRDKDYLSELNRIAAERDLSDKLNYKDEMQRLVMGDNLNRMVEDLDFKRAMGADQRTWNEKLAQMDMDMAIKVATSAIKDESTRQMWTGTGNLAKAGIDASMKVDSKSPGKIQNKQYEGPNTGIYDEVGVTNNYGATA